MTNHFTLDFKWFGLRVFFDEYRIFECTCLDAACWEKMPNDGVVGISMHWAINGSKRHSYYTGADYYFRFVRRDGKWVIAYTNDAEIWRRYDKERATTKLGRWVPLEEMALVDIAAREMSAPSNGCREVTLGTT